MYYNYIKAEYQLKAYKLTTTTTTTGKKTFTCANSTVKLRIKTIEVAVRGENLEKPN